MKQKRYRSGYYSVSLIAAIAVIAIVAVVVVIAAVNSGKASPTGTADTRGTETSDTSTSPGTAADPTHAPKTTETSDPTTPPKTSETSDPTLPPKTSDPVISTETGDSSVTLAPTPDAGMEYIEKMVFLGDSTTYHMLFRDDWDNYTGSPLADGNHWTNVWSGTAHTLTLQYVNDPNTKIIYYDTNEELTIAEAAAKKKPEILVITLGVNGVLYMPEAYFKAVYTEMVRSIQTASPTTKIILNSMFPVQQFYSDETIPQSQIDVGNRWIAEMAAELGCYFLNSAECLKNESGVLPDEYSKGDGVHLSNYAYEILFDYIRTHAIPEYVK